ncbi:BrnA antitoxin family protein [bacterium]|nr:BrnA antitoxin family protein [bacterium]
MKKSEKKLPKFKSEDEEFDFWSSHDSMDFFGATEEIQEKLQISKPKRAKQRITMLLDPRLKAALQKIAAEKGIPYQSLIQMWLREMVNLEIKRRLAS